MVRVDPGARHPAIMGSFLREDHLALARTWTADGQSSLVTVWVREGIPRPTGDLALAATEEEKALMQGIVFETGRAGGHWTEVDQFPVKIQNNRVPVIDTMQPLFRLALEALPQQSQEDRRAHQVCRQQEIQARHPGAGVSDIAVSLSMGIPALRQFVYVVFGSVRFEVCSKPDMAISEALGFGTKQWVQKHYPQTSARLVLGGTGVPTLSTTTPEEYSTDRKRSTSSSSCSRSTTGG